MALAPLLVGARAIGRIVSVRRAVGGTSPCWPPCRWPVRRR